MNNEVNPLRCAIARLDGWVWRDNSALDDPDRDPLVGAWWHAMRQGPYSESSLPDYTRSRDEIIEAVLRIDEAEDLSDVWLSFIRNLATIVNPQKCANWFSREDWLMVTATAEQLCKALVLATGL